MMAIFTLLLSRGTVVNCVENFTRDNFNKRAPTSKIDQAILSETHNNFGHLVKWNGTLNIQFVPQ